ncbi:MAG: hypothetical protein KKI09_00915, partial [Spirochaetes bacterium]|nr:hypothetical protein [Spirochaetota bacterium]
GLAAHQPGYPQSHAASSGHSGAVRSRPSETANLSDLKPGLTIPAVISLLHSGISRNLAGRPLAGHPAIIGGRKLPAQPDLPTEKTIMEFSNIFLSAQWKESRLLPALPTAAALRSASVPAGALNYTNRKGNL